MVSFGPRGRDGSQGFRRGEPLAASSDEAVIQRCLQGDPESFSVLVDRYRDQLYGYAYHVVGDAEEARDLAQETFVRAYSALPRFRPGAPFSSWLYTIAANLCKSWLRKKKHAPVSVEEVFSDGHAPALAEPPDETASPDVAYSREEFRKIVLAAVNTLPTKYRLVVVLRHLNDLSYQDIAAILKLPVTTVEHRLRTAREMLKPRLKQDLEGWEW